MSVSYEIIADPAQLAEITRMLADVRDGVPRVLTRSINKVGVAARTQIVRAVSSQVNLKPSELRARNIFLRQANYDTLEAVIRISGRRVPIKSWGARPTRRGVTYAIRRGGRQVIPGAFVATMKSGHVGVFQRRPGKGRRVAGSQLPIVEQFGPSVPVVVENIEELSQSVMDRQIAEKLSGEIDKQVGLAINRKGGFN